jgi:hypothetical protein
MQESKAMWADVMPAKIVPAAKEHPVNAMVFP